MKFGEFPVAGAEGLMLAHAVRLPELTLRKGHRVSPADVETLKQGGIIKVTAALIEDGDLDEDEAARRLAAAIVPDHLRFSEAATGRVNVYAATDGLFVAASDVVDRVNRIDPAITLACLADHVRVRAGDMVATIKIIPLALPGNKVEAACDALRTTAAFEVKPFREYAVSLVATELPSLKTAVMDKTTRVLERRLKAYGNRLAREKRVAHRQDAVAAAIDQVTATAEHFQKLIIIFGASAVIDKDDVIPAAIRQAGGEVLSVGMPVDPGNLIVLGRTGDTYVVGAPGCARSPRENGFDWVLDRILAGEEPDTRDLTGMGVGGLLMEIETRPRPREVAAEPSRPVTVAAVILAAGMASRMGEGGAHKLLAEFDGEPLVRRTTKAALGVEPASVIVVTGHRRSEIEASLSGLDVTFVENPDYASGMASSLISGFSAPGAGDADGVLVMLADMPGVKSANLNLLIEAFRSASGRAIVRAVSRGKRGNPVILPRAVGDAVMRLEGDIGARHIIESSGLPVIDVDIGDAAHLDVDTPEAVQAAGGVLTR
ncbi:NTP transferase domain-containing protein [Agrobacterium pusense]|uniref:NTP transferase domain-containing protein n=1 Tax=Agrobacterium pusense TaxID=648995 RepID=UPI001C6EDC68|nr:NTP transferase domain-containing protein [Agrobacterium pusense]MBW9070152.1 NTP transferase domain-containing protein [Agrobacterium pusense]MBW9085008.1 NTP transferase domain-containing protein [Agrobacterium pusense]MBW9125517.1 NTP transferase domain-containing protein [Agrobacterium pusense]MBW9137932.1 NTP transferase domain-containing protein [Agrobacterium pusense]